MSSRTRTGDGSNLVAYENTPSLETQRDARHQEEYFSPLVIIIPIIIVLIVYLIDNINLWWRHK